MTATLNDKKGGRVASSLSGASFLSGGGTVGALMRAHDWSGSPLGNPEGWPEPLRLVVGLLLNSMFPMFAAWGPELGFLYNDAYAEILGAKHPASLGARFHDIWTEIWADISPLIDAALAGRSTYREDLPLLLNRHGYDEQTWFTFSYSPVLGESGAVEGMFCAVAETTLQVRARRHAAFRLLLEQRLRDLADAHEIMDAATETLGQELGIDRVGYAEIDQDQEFVTVERNWAAEGTPHIAGSYRLSAFEPAMMAGIFKGEILAIDDVTTDPRVGRGAEAFADIGMKATVAVPLIKDERLTAALYLHHGAPRRWDEELPLIAEVADRTWAAVERARAEAELRESEQRLRLLNESLERQVAAALAERKLLADIVEDTDVLIHVADRNYNWLAINRAAANEFTRAFGVGPPQAGDNMLALLAGRPQLDEFKARWSRALAGEEFIEVHAVDGVRNQQRSYEMRFRSLHDENGRLVGAYQFVQDVTERLSEQARLREAEAALMQLQKMEAVGRLTGGIAHDFNNLLGAIVGSLDLIQRKPEDIARVKRFAEAGLEAAERGAKLTGQLLAFSRSQRIELKPVLIVELVSGMRELLARTLGPMIRLHFALDDPRSPVLSDPTQLEMAVLNLAINSRDAMPGSGDLTIATAVRRIERDVDLPAGDYVELSVTDTGSGMPAEVLAKAFDPFFTTKGIGEGTGLGLSQVYGIARQAGGTARIESEPGQGTTVRLYLPLLTLQPADEAAASDCASKAQTAARGATILLVDDDPDLRRILAASMETLGYKVIAADDGAAGLEVLRTHTPDLVMVDFAMPGMNGADFATAARRLKPGLPIVFASGYAETAAIEKAAGPHTVVLRKPFRIEELETVIAIALNEKAGIHPSASTEARNGFPPSRE